MTMIRQVSIMPRINDATHLLLSPSDRDCPEGSSRLSLAAWENANGMPATVLKLVEQAPEWAGVRLLDVILERQCLLVDGSRSIPDAVAICRLGCGLGIVVSEAKKQDGFGDRSVPFDGSVVSDGGASDALLIEQLGLAGYRGPAIPIQLLCRASNAISIAQEYGAEQACFVVHSFAAFHKHLAAFQRLALAMGWPDLHRGTLSPARTTSGISLRIGWASGT
ncbi:hypothetical protein C8J24_0662 [Sphingomonas aerolata]|uniref:DUF6946 domain-containing protein n=1 Tax=Sphingomonas aerolata TaxID=185951 RepID=A0A2T4YU56_9SPHN|nr:hypothetical protein [Sphingomonas aerolata]PTM47271.1 hypothetical protein C8J24_0662 [Sphingomonas aerolata]